MTAIGPVTQSLACRLIKERMCWAQTQEASDRSVADNAVQAFAQLLDMHQNGAELAKADHCCEKPPYFLPDLQLHAVLESLWTSQVQKTKLSSSLGPLAAQQRIRDVRLGCY
jgi:hypothetical protein